MFLIMYGTGRVCGRIHLLTSSGRSSFKCLVAVGKEIMAAITIDIEPVGEKEPQKYYAYNYKCWFLPIFITITSVVQVRSCLNITKSVYHLFVQYCNWFILYINILIAFMFYRFELFFPYDNKSLTEYHIL